jgi:polyhydroxybutyrate depolymerase
MRIKMASRATQCWPLLALAPLLAGCANELVVRLSGLGIMAEEIRPGSFSIRWSSAADPQGREANSYSVLVNGREVVSRSPVHEYAADDLTPGSSYAVEVMAYGQAGGTASTWTQIQTLPQGHGRVRTSTITFQGGARTFSVYLPASVGTGDSLPLLVTFHGSGGVAKVEVQDPSLLAIAERDKVILAHPQALPYATPNEKNAEWTLGTTPWDDCAFVDNMLDQVLAAYPIDRGRVYFRGMSSGGFMTYAAAQRLQDRVAALAPIAGGVIGPPQEYVDKLTRPTPLLAIHGTADSIVPYQNDVEIVAAWKIKNECSSEERSDLPHLHPEDLTTVTRFHYWGKDENSQIYFYRVNGGGHAVPGLEQGANQDFNSDEVQWEFLRQFRHPNPR